MVRNHYSILYQILADNGIQKEPKKLEKNILINHNMAIDKQMIIASIAALLLVIFIWEQLSLFFESAANSTIGHAEGATDLVVRNSR